MIATKFLGVQQIEDSHWRPPITTDGAANISAAVDQNPYAFWMKCCLHIFNLCVQEGRYYNIFFNCN